MIDIRAQLDDPRRRNLAILGAAALVTILLAILGIAYQAEETSSHVTPELLFPNLAAEADRIAQIRIATAKGSVDIVFKPEKGWVVANHDDYPASFETVRETVVGLAALMTLEPKTARADWLSYLDLDTPGGKGTQITLLDDKNTVLAAVIVGKTTDIGDPSGATGLFVRRPGETQSWLARSVFVPKTDVGDWFDKTVMSIDRSRIAEADVDPISGPSYTVRRDNPNDADFKVVDLPKGRAVAYDGAPDAVGAAVVDFSFDDIAPAKNFDFSDPSHAARVVTKTFDGLMVTVNVIQQGQDYWATVSAEGSTPGAEKEARSIDAHASGWAFKLPAYKGQQFMTPLENLLQPLAATSPQSH